MEVPISLTYKLILQFRWVANSSIDRINARGNALQSCEVRKL